MTILMKNVIFFWLTTYSIWATGSYNQAIEALLKLFEGYKI